MKHLILGSSGQIGSSLTHYLRSRGETVFEFDLVRAKEEDLRLHHNVLLKEKVKQADFVYFLAFDVGGSRYLKTYQHAYEFISNNVKLMQNTFDVLEETKKPFIFASSQMSNMGYSPYGQLKAIGESYTRALNGLVVKFWNVYGVEHDLTKSHVITDFILKAHHEKRIDMLTDGTELRQFLYADDCSECLRVLAERYNDIPRDRELHITNFEWHSIMDVANVVASLYPDTSIHPASSVDDVQKDKRNEPDSFILSVWKPKTTLNEGIRRVNELMFSEMVLA